MKFTLPSIQALKLRKVDLMEEVEVGHDNTDGVYRDFCDGSFMKNLVLRCYSLFFILMRW